MVQRYFGEEVQACKDRSGLQFVNTDLWTRRPEIKDTILVNLNLPKVFFFFLGTFIIFMPLLKDSKAQFFTSFRQGLVIISGHLIGCGGADSYNFLTSASSKISKYRQESSLFLSSKTKQKKNEESDHFVEDFLRNSDKKTTVFVGEQSLTSRCSMCLFEKALDTSSLSLSAWLLLKLRTTKF